MYFRDRLVFVSAGGGLLINIIIWILLLGKFGFGNLPVPLHFNVVYGIDYVGKSGQIYELALAGLVIVLVNGGLGRIVYGQEKLLGYFLAGASLFAQLILLIAALSIVIL